MRLAATSYDTRRFPFRPSSALRPPWQAFYVACLLDSVLSGSGNQAGWHGACARVPLRRGAPGLTPGHGGPSGLFTYGVREPGNGEGVGGLTGSGSPAVCCAAPLFCKATQLPSLSGWRSRRSGNHLERRRARTPGPISTTEDTARALPATQAGTGPRTPAGGTPPSRPPGLLILRGTTKALPPMAGPTSRR